MVAISGERKVDNWSSRLTFIMASVGFSVGLGNIWRFPYVTGENGGAAFIIVYLACALCIGVPLVMAEWAIGRRALNAASAVGSFREVAISESLSSKSPLPCLLPSSPLELRWETQTHTARHGL